MASPPNKILGLVWVVVKTLLTELVPALVPGRQYGNTRQQEKTLNLFLVDEVFMQLLATGFGFLSSVWATVVLLGGFASMLHKMDFWFATPIVFVQTARIIGFNPYPEGRFFSEAPEACINLFVKPLMQRVMSWSASGGSSVGKRIVLFCKVLLIPIALLIVIALLIAIAPVVAAVGCITLSIIRLLDIVGKDYVGASADSSVNTANLKPALIFFYALVLTQGACVLLHLALRVLRCRVAGVLRKNCGFNDTEDTKKLIDKYIDNTLDTCIQAGVSNTIKRNLVSFAQDLLKNDSADGHLTAVSVLHTLVEQDAYRESVISQVESSQQCLVKLFEIISSKSLADGTTKARAAAVVAKLASNMHLTDMPAGAIESLVSMLEPPPSFEMAVTLTHGTNVNNGRIINEANLQNANRHPESKPLIVHSLLILGQFACDPENCAKICSTKGLVSKMITPLCNGMHFLATRDDDPICIEVMKESIGVLTKLVKGTSDQTCTSTELRKQILGSDRSSNKHRLTNITGQAADSRNTTLLIGIITTLCQDEATRGNFQHMSEFVDEMLRLCFGDTNNKVRIISELLGLFFGANNSEDTAISAAQALAALARSSEGNLTKMMITEAEIVAGGGQTVIQKLTDMLGTVTNRRRKQASIARVLSHLCTIYTTQQLQPLRSKFPMLLRAIVGAEQDVQLDVDDHVRVGERKSVAALLSLSVQMISADLLPGTAAQVIPMNHIWFVKKLKIIIKRNREATPDCVEIIRAMAQLCIWIIEKNHIAVKLFQDATIHEALRTAEKAVLNLERSMLLTGSVPDPANYETVSSLVKRVNLLILFYY